MVQYAHLEKAHARIEGTVAEKGGLTKMIFDWAKLGSASRCLKPGKLGRSLRRIVAGL